MTSAPYILVIDDDEAVRNALCDNLRDCGFGICEASNGIDGIKAADNAAGFDVIITDIIMPEVDGIDVIKEIRRHNSNVKIIAISGGRRMGAEDSLEYARKAGADEAFAKPLDIDRLEATILRLVS